MPEPDENIDQLIFKYLQQTISEAEQYRLYEWINILDDNFLHFQKLTDQQYISGELEKLYSYNEAKGWNTVKKALPFSKHPVVKKFFQPTSNRKWIYGLRIACAAVFLILVISGYYFATPRDTTINKVKVVHTKEPLKNDVLPGGNKAVLTLADGSTIVLDDTQNGTLAQQGNSRVLNSQGKLAYMPSKAASKEILYNTISTPPGGQYQIVLPDGSVVWLNAASSLRFPASFTGKERNVAITGEAYFEIAHNNAMPFILSVNDSKIKVLGTHFDVMAYGDEAALEITLLEGSVNFIKDEMHTLLQPGQQSRLTKNGQIKVLKDVDVDEIMAWKNGYFYFERADIETVMRQLARWYNVEVVYQNKKTGDLFHADIPRNTKLSEVLKALEIAGGLQFKIQGQKIIVI